MSEIRQDRRFVLGLGTVMGVAGLPTIAAAQGGAVTAPGRWQPTLDPQDAWMDRAGTRHRLMFDTTAVDAAGSAMFYADNFYAANKKGYGLAPEALGVIIVLRHLSTPFGFNDAIWAKYGATLADKLKMQGEQAIRAARQNPLLSAVAAPQPAKAGTKPADEPVTLALLARRGARFAVCGTASEGMAGILAKATGGDAKAVLKEMNANLIPGAVMVPAGILAVNRAQEHGYAFVNVPGE